MTGPGRRYLTTLSWYALVTVAAVVFPLALLIALPSVGHAADQAGLPGGSVALAILFIVAAFSLIAVLRRLSPSGRRRRAFTKSAPGLGLRSSPFFVLPDGLHGLPAFTVPGRSSGFGSLMSGRSTNGSVLVFDYWTGDDTSFIPPHWYTAVGRTIGHVIPEAVRFPAIVIEPRTLAHPLEQRRGLPDVVSESEAFNDRFRITTEDARFASAFVDQRMMTWLLEQPNGWWFEVWGDWAVCTTDQLEPERIPALVDALDGLCAHIPRVVRSMYPADRRGLA